MESTDILYEGKMVPLVRITKKAPWLFKCAGGRACRKGSLRRSIVIDDMRTTLLESLQKDETAADDAGAAVAAPARIDPMQVLDDLDAPSAKRTKTARTPKAPCASQVHAIQMPEVWGSPQLRTVRAMFKTGKERSLWLHMDDVPWLVSYVKAELESGGLDPILHPDGSDEDFEDEHAPPEGAAVAAPPGLDPLTPVKKGQHRARVRWNFKDAWEGTIAHGPRKGDTIKCRVDTLTEEKWDQVAQYHKCDVAFENANDQDKKEAARLFLVEYLQRTEREAQGACIAGS